MKAEAQWPGYYCDTESGCCYPSTGKHASNFSIHGLWPNFNNGDYPSNCNSNNPLDPSQISDLRSEMSKEWFSLAMGTPLGTRMAALLLKERVDVLGALENAGIHPDGSQYSLESIQNGLTGALDTRPGILECNRDESGNDQLYQIYLCVDTSASNLISCPVPPSSKCSSQLVFPSF
eukprot:Gb_05908 [translate_table: standard]